jgi:hypothetical protein
MMKLRIECLRSDKTNNQYGTSKVTRILGKRCRFNSRDDVNLNAASDAQIYFRPLCFNIYNIYPYIYIKAVAQRVKQNIHTAVCNYLK